MSRGAKRQAWVLQALALVGVLAALIVMGARNLQLMNFHLFIGLLVALIAAVLVVFALSGGERGGS